MLAILLVFFFISDATWNDRVFTRVYERNFRPAGKTEAVCPSNFRRLWNLGKQIFIIYVLSHKRKINKALIN